MNRDKRQFYKTNKYQIYPLFMQIEITKACIFTCSQCYKQGLADKHMNFSHLCDLLDEVNENGVKCIALNGGEPLLYPQLVPLLEKLKEMDFAVQIFSSGYGLCDLIVDNLKVNQNLHMFISLNGSTESVNNLSREGYEYAMCAIQQLSKAGIRFGINWVARDDNIHDFENIIELGILNKVSYISIVPNRNCGCQAKVFC